MLTSGAQPAEPPRPQLALCACTSGRWVQLTETPTVLVWFRASTIGVWGTKLPTPNLQRVQACEVKPTKHGLWCKGGGVLLAGLKSLRCVCTCRASLQSPDKLALPCPRDAKFAVGDFSTAEPTPKIACVHSKEVSLWWSGRPYLRLMTAAVRT